MSSDVAETHWEPLKDTLFRSGYSLFDKQLHFAFLGFPTALCGTGLSYYAENINRGKIEVLLGSLVPFSTLCAGCARSMKMETKRRS